MTTIHLTNGDVAADSLRKALHLARRSDAVLALRDDLAVGSLQGVDDAPQVRAEFWQRVIGDAAHDLAAGFEAQANALESVVGGTEHVVAWHGESAADQLMLRRACFHLREMPQRLNEVRLSFDDLRGDASASLRRPDHATSVGMFAPELLRKRLASAAPISVLRIGRLALEWQEAKLVDAELRRWRDNTFASGTFAELDALIAGHAVDGWQPAGRVAAQVMAADNGLLVSDSLVLWRLRELAAAGRLQLRGDDASWHALEMNVIRATLSPA